MFSRDDAEAGQEQTEALRAALFRLIALPLEEAERAARALADLLPLAERYPLSATGEWAWLNPMLWKARHDPAKLRTYLSLVSLRREDSALSRVRLGGKASTAQRPAYQNALMRERRRRAALAAAVENARRPASQQLTGASRAQFMARMEKEWSAGRRAFLDAERRAAGGRLTKARERELIAEYWAQVDARLDEAERALRHV
jgi:hypothetical protein